MTIGVAVIGFGFMGRTHAAAFESARLAGYPCELRGIATDDPSPAPDVAAPRLTTEALLDDPGIELVSICTPTDTHVELAIRALEAGKHVVVEKPVALDVAGIKRLAAVAERTGKVCLPAMCMRWWPGWSWLRDHIFSRTFGAVRAARFERLNATPDWSPFYRNANRSGSALFDLHIHDTDFVRCCFGEPSAVTSVGNRNHLTTLYHYERGPRHVVAEGGWFDEPGMPFVMRYRVEFERAVVEFDLSADPTVRVIQGTTASPVRFPPETAYDLEIRHALDLVQGRRRPLATLQDAIKTTELLHAELKSLGSQSRVTV